MVDPIAENEAPFLPKDYESVSTAHNEYHGRRIARRSIVTAVLVSAIVSVVGTLVLHNFIPISHYTSNTSSPQELLPSLDLPPLGSVLRTYVGGRAYYDKNLNASREEWMSLFPRTLQFIIVVI